MSLHASFVILGSTKAKNRVQVDVETILANCIAIKLKHYNAKCAIARERKEFKKLFPRKRPMASNSTASGPPSKRLCTVNRN